MIVGELPGLDSNQYEIINSDLCCHYITGDRKPETSNTLFVLITL